MRFYPPLPRKSKAKNTCTVQLRKRTVAAAIPRTEASTFACWSRNILQFYAPFHVEDYALCFSCHSQDLVLTKETSNLTDFRNGDLNLHYLHVNKPQRGRTCRSCHATHASNLPKHIRESVPFGTWSLPIEFKKTQTGGSCAPGCHLPKKYDRNDPVDYSALPAEKE